MASPVTTPYSLFAGENNTDHYYRDISLFAVKALDLLEENLGSVTDALISFYQDDQDIKNYSREELLLEALMIGVYWNRYGRYAEESSDALIVVMKQLALLRKVPGQTGKSADEARGILGLNMMENPEHENSFLMPGIIGFEKLINWMEATGEFHREARQFGKWMHFMKDTGDGFTFICISLMRNIARQFSTISDQHLGKFTLETENFHSTVRQKYSKREDGISVNRSSTEYHLGMLGAYLINESNREKYRNSAHKVLLVPSCMKRNPLTCRAMQTKYGEICNSCSKNCRVNELNQLGKTNNFKVVILKHSSDLSVWAPEPGKSITGVVGVACPATLLAGGFELKHHNIAAQCVVLDHCGCHHWMDNPVSTSLNIKELLRRMEGDSAGCFTARQININSEESIEVA
jgi:hypothetical protein